jgi:hypothetical protein
MQEDEASSDPNSAADSTEAVGQPCLRLRDWRPLARNCQRAGTSEGS